MTDTTGPAAEHITWKLFSGRSDTESMSAAMLDIGDICRRLKVGRSTLYRMRASGDFPTGVTLPGGIIRWSEEDIAEWLSSLPGG